MADTDDELSGGLDTPDRRPLRRDEGAPGQEAAGRDRRAEEWSTGTTSDSPVTALDGTATDEAAEPERAAELQRREIERQRLADERIEQDARAQRELEDSRYRHDVNQAAADRAEALRRARTAERERDYLRGEAAGERGLARTDRSEAVGLRTGAAGRDDPAADADRAAADRFQSSANYEDRRANYDDALSDSYGAEARDHRAEAARVPAPQPPPVEAVRTPPPQAPVARKNLKPKQRGKKQLKDFGLGD